MKIGIDIRPLQTGHQYRGIGEVTKQVTNRILDKIVTEQVDSVIFYEYEGADPKELLDIPETLRYKVVKQGYPPDINKGPDSNRLSRNFAQLYGNPVINSNESDVFLQFEYNFGVPNDTRVVLIKHDIIPFIFWDQFFESAWVPFKNKAARTTLRTLFANYKYIRILKRSLKAADSIITVSHSTKNDIVSLLGVKEKKVSVVPLGVDVTTSKTAAKKSKVAMPTKPYLLFIGAGDERRRVDDLVAAFNNLKASGIDIQLALVGENFADPNTIPNKVTRDAVVDSSYHNDILTLGYVDDTTKQELYKNAIAFVYPTLYEGFGIPILESMLFECPVITYKNSSIPEVAGSYALYAKDWTGIYEHVKYLLGISTKERKKLTRSAMDHARKFTWDATSQCIFQKIKDSKTRSD